MNFSKSVFFGTPSDNCVLSDKQALNSGAEASTQARTSLCQRVNLLSINLLRTLNFDGLANVVSAAQHLSSQPIKCRQVQMPANPLSPVVPDLRGDTFPHVVHYQLVNVPPCGQTQPALSDPTFQRALKAAIHSRQGVFEWVQTGDRAVLSNLQDYFDRRGDLELGDGVFILGARIDEMYPDTERWILQVSAPRTDKLSDTSQDIFTVPWTTMHFGHSRGDRKAALALSDVAWGTHLLAVNPAYRDNAENPMILSGSRGELSQLQAARAEIRSRLYAGLIRNNQMLEQTLWDVVPEFVPCETGDRVQLLFNRAVPANLDRAISEDAYLFSKRHFPPKQNSVNWGATSRSISTQILQDECLEVTQSNLRSLSLVGQSPMCNQPLSGLAFRQTSQDNHCGLAAINGFFQAEVIHSVQAVNAVLDGMEGVLCTASPTAPEHLEQLNLPGLYHPALISAMREGRQVAISRDEFLSDECMQNYAGNEAFFYEAPEEQWISLVNYSMGDISYLDEQQQNEYLQSRYWIVVSPELWLAAATGIHADSLESMLNQFLATKGNQPAWRNYPNQVERLSLNVESTIDNLESRINRQIDGRPPENGNNLFPMICMVHGHYFALARTSQGDWLKLDSNGTMRTGLQCTEIFAKRGELALALKEIRAIHVICEPLPAR